MPNELFLYIGRKVYEACVKSCRTLWWINLGYVSGKYEEIRQMEIKNAKVDVCHQKQSLVQTEEMM